MAILGKYDEHLSILQVFHTPLLYTYREIPKCERQRGKIFEKTFFIILKKTDIKDNILENSSAAITRTLCIASIIVVFSYHRLSDASVEAISAALCFCVRLYIRQPYLS